MIRNYIKVALRNLRRNTLYALMNILGISIAIAWCLVAYLNYEFAISFDTFHKNSQEIYRVMGKRTINQQELRWGATPIPLAEQIAQESPSVLRAVNIERAQVTVRIEDHFFPEVVLFADNGFFEMFTFPLKSGVANLQNKHQIVISEAAALKYFGTENPIGKPLTLVYQDGQQQVVTVTGITQELPKNSSIRFDLVAASQLLMDAGVNKPGTWNYNSTGLFLQVRDPRSVPDINRQMQQYIPLQNASSQRAPLSSLFLERMQESALQAHDTRGYGFSQPYPSSQLISIAVMAFLALVLSCFNFINTSLAIASKRFREIGIRKVVGGTRLQLIVQYLSENIVLCLIALSLALLLTLLLLPAFNTIFPAHHLEMNILNEWKAILFLLFMLVVTGIGAGLYPALVISALQPIKIFREKQKAGRVGLLMRILLTLQFALSILAVVGGIVFAQNAEFIETFDLGFQKTHILSLPIDGKSFSVYRDAIRDFSKIESISGSRSHIIYSGSRRSVHYADFEREAFAYTIGFNYLETMRIRLNEGRGFSEQMIADTGRSVLVNQTLAKEMGWTNAVGKTVTMENQQYQVIGMIEDVYSQGVWELVLPSVLRVTTPEQYTAIQIRVQQGAISETLEYLRKSWIRLFPGIAFQAIFENQAQAEAVRINESVVAVFSFNAVITMFISAMGLFALVSLTIANRTKEVGIRKTLGATVSNLMSLILKDFVVVLVVAMIIADIGSFALIGALLNAVFVYHTSIGALALLAGNLLVFVIGIGTVLYHTTKAATTNPVTALRYE